MPTLGGEAPPLAVYIHWPFCRAKCPYCDFNSHVAPVINHRRWRNALIAELDHVASLVANRRVTSIFFGGGTPSLMPPDIVADVITHIDHHWGVHRPMPATASTEPYVEITLEANPTSAETARLRDFFQAGINRLSLGVQSLNDDALAFLGRAHSPQDALKALDTARNIFPRVSADMIYARPGQNCRDWHDELRRLIPHLGDHVSLYQLTIEKGTPFFARHRAGDIVLPQSEQAVALYETSDDLLATAGYTSYEISNYARPQAACRHNLTYWRYGEYAGIGPGAHARLRLDPHPRTALVNISSPENWLKAVERQGQGLARRHGLDDKTAREECLIMGLRLREGIDLGTYRTLFGDSLNRARLDPLIESGDLVLTQQRLAVTAQGRLRLNALLRYLVA